MASDVVAACEAAWRAFQVQHPDLPDAVIVLGSGVDRGRLVKLGHWWGGRWEAGNELRGEVLLAGEALHLPVEDVFEVLLHEAAHGLNAARGIKDTSRGGRYHNARFKTTAVEVGLDVDMMPPYGWAKTTLTPAAIDRYATEIDELRDAVRIARRLDPARTFVTGAGQDEAGTGEAGQAKSSAMACGCGRRIRMATSVAAQGPVTCGLCGVEFSSGESARSAASPSDVVHLRPVAVDPPTGSISDQAEAFAVLGNWIDTPERLATAARVMAWAGRSSASGLELDGEDPGELNELARAVRRGQGLVIGPDLDVGPMVLAAGDLVVVSAGAGARDVVPDVGVLGQVVTCDPARQSLVVDFPIAGEYHLTAAEAGRHLSYGYALPHDLADRPHRSPAPTGEPPQPRVAGRRDRDRAAMTGPLDAALRLARRGFEVLPCHATGVGGCSCRQPDCGSPGKHPRTRRGLHDATTDPAEIGQWWRQWPTANVGVRTGAVSGLVVIDIDPEHGGLDTMRSLAAEHAS